MLLFFALRPHDLAIIFACTCRNLTHSVDTGLIDTSGGLVHFDTSEAMILMKAESDVAIITGVSILLAIENLTRGVDEPHYGVHSCVICVPDRIRHLEPNMVL